MQDGSVCDCCKHHKNIEQFINVDMKRSSVCKQCKIRYSLEYTESLVNSARLSDGEKKIKDPYKYCVGWPIEDNIRNAKNRELRYNFMYRNSIVMDRIIFDSFFYQKMVDHMWRRWEIEYDKADKKVYIFIVNDTLQPIADVYTNAVNHFKQEHEKVIANVALYIKNELAL